MGPPWARRVPEPRSSPAEGSSGRRRSPGHRPTTGKVWPGHDRKQLSAIRHLTLGDGGDNLLGGPPSEARFLVGGQVAADENANAEESRIDLGARECALRVSLAEKSAGRTTAAAPGNCHQIFAALDLSFIG